MRADVILIAGALTVLPSNNRIELNAVVCSRVPELQEALSAATIALGISSRNGCAPAWT